MQNIHWQLLDSWHCMRDEADTDTDRAERGRGAEIGLTSPWVIGALSRRLLLLALARSLWNEYCTSICHSFWTYLKMTFNIFFFFIQYLLTATYIFVFMAITATLAAYALAGSKNTKPQHRALSGVIWGTTAAAAAAATLISPIRSKLFPFRASMKFDVHFWKIWQASLSLINSFKILFTQ